MPNGIYELPPMLGNDTKQNTEVLRSFLVRLINDLNTAQTSIQTASGGLKTVNGKKVIVTTSGTAKEKDLSDVEKNANDLRALIMKTADDIGVDMETMRTEMQSSYVARSEYGDFVESVNTQIETSAKGVVESYGYDSLIQSNQEAINLLQQYTFSLDGQIKRGIVLDPDTNSYVLGIAISQALQFTGEKTTGSDGYEYYYMTEGQTFGLYTSTGWQFWVDGYKKGWYNSVDGMLHIANALIEDKLQFGSAAQFIVASDGRFGIRKI